MGPTGFEGEAKDANKAPCLAALHHIFPRRCLGRCPKRGAVDCGTGNHLMAAVGQLLGWHRFSNTWCLLRRPAVVCWSTCTGESLLVSDLNSATPCACCVCFKISSSNFLESDQAEKSCVLVSGDLSVVLR